MLGALPVVICRHIWGMSHKVLTFETAGRQRRSVAGAGSTNGALLCWPRCVTWSADAMLNRDHRNLGRLRLTCLFMRYGDPACQTYGISGSPHILAVTRLSPSQTQGWTA